MWLYTGEADRGLKVNQSNQRQGKRQGFVFLLAKIMNFNQSKNRQLHTAVSKSPTEINHAPRTPSKDRIPIILAQNRNFFDFSSLT